MPAGNSLVESSTPQTPAGGAAQLPALIFFERETAVLRVATLTLLDRLVVAIHRAGLGPITIVAADPLPELKRTRALRIPFQTCTQAPFVTEPPFVASSKVLAQAQDIRRCVEMRSRLLSNDGEPLPLGVVDSLAGSIETALSNLPTVRPGGIARLIGDDASRRSAECALWASLTSSSDGFIDKIFNRPCGRPLSRVLIHTPVTPNIVSITSIIIGVISAFLFANGTPGSILVGAVLFQVSAIIDCVDGDIARILFKESPLGKWIDFAGDQIVHVSVFAGIALGVAKVSAAPEILWLGVSAVVGALFSFGVILRGMRSPAGPSTLLKRFIDAATNRDFSVLVLILAAFQKLDLFLWMAAIGSHVFWIGALTIQLKAHQPAAVASQSRPAAE